MPGLAGPLTLSPAIVRPQREAGTWTTYIYLLIASGALFPLRFIPINYEWISIAATAGIFLNQLRRFGPGRLGEFRSLFWVVALIVLYQSVKVLVSPEEVDMLQFLRSLYGLFFFALGVMLVATNPLRREDFLGIAGNVLLILFVLVFLSIASGFRLYAAGFLPEAGTGDIQSEVASGNYRIITYYSTFVAFLFFTNLLLFLRDHDRRGAIISFASLALILLTGTRSLIAPCIAVAAIIVVRQARPSTTALFGMMTVLFGALVYAAIPDIVGAYLSRFYVGEAFDGWRALEQELARQAIGTAPLVGLPMGTPYSHVMSAMAGGTEGYTLNADYDLHNEYLWSLLYFGVIGFSILAYLVFNCAKRVYTSSRGSMFSWAFFSYLLVMLATMNYSSVLLKGYGALWFGIVVSLCSLAVHHSGADPFTDSAS